jgi:polysaccharide deacetylase family sporulation protein PdaB
VVVFVVGRRSHLTAAVAGLIALLALIGAMVAARDDPVMAVQSNARLVPVYSVAREDKAVAITVDATWGADITPQLLDLFDRHSVKVTFFLAGNWITHYPDMVKEIASRGHELGNHSWTHPNMGSLPREKIRDELSRTQNAIANLTGTTPKVFRPPFGDYSNSLITEAEALGLTTIQWSIDSLDWKNPTPREIIDRVMGRMKPGAIVLFHNAAESTPPALAQIIPALQQQGYSLVRVSELLLTGDTYIDRNSGEQRRRPARSLEPEPVSHEGPVPYASAVDSGDDDGSGIRPRPEAEVEKCW